MNGVVVCGALIMSLSQIHDPSMSNTHAYSLKKMLFVNLFYDPSLSSTHASRLYNPMTNFYVSVVSEIMDDKQVQKAVWDTDAARIFCEIACKEANEGNRPTKTLVIKI